MRVLLMGPYARPHGGVQAHLVALREFLLEQNVPCAVINLTHYRDEPAEEVYYPGSAVELLRVLGRLRYDVVHLHIGGTLPLRLVALSLLSCMLPRTKTVLTFHSGGYPSSNEGRASRRRSLRGFVLRRVDRLIAVNRELLELYHRLGCSAERTRLIYPHAVRPLSASDDQMLPALQQFRDDHRTLLLSVGQLEPEYEIPLQIEALGRIRERRPDAGLAIVGAGSLEHELREIIRKTSYAEHVLLCGDVPHGSTLRAIAESDVLLRTTRYDGDSIAVREALHLGTPVVATNNGMRPPRVELVPSGSVSAVVEAVERILIHRPTGRPRPVAAADERNLEAILRLYRELAGELPSERGPEAVMRVGAGTA